MPKLPPGVETLRIAPPHAATAVACDASFAAAEGEECGLEIVPRHQGGREGDVADFMSPGVDSGVSKYSI